MNLDARTQGIETNSQGNMGHPLSHSNFDHPRAQLVVIISFDRTNNMAWSREIMMALGANCKLGFVDGTFEKLAAGSIDAQRWSRADFMVIC